MQKFLFFFLLVYSSSIFGQDISINNGWLFKTGDSILYASPNLNDKEWAPIKIGQAWETQGYKNYDGFAWYRLHIVIPSSIKNKAFLKERLRFDLGMIDDGDEVYLNGAFIGRNAWKSSDIKQGPYDMQRTYSLPLNDYRIHWDQDNVIAVRVWDGGGDGGMYGGKYGISVMDVTDFIEIHTGDAGFQFGPKGQLSKKISLHSTSDKYDFVGKLQIVISDPTNAAVVFKQTLGIDFSKDRPFEYTYKTTLPENKSYEVRYQFEEERTKKIVLAKEGIPYILTPKPAASPKINGPSVYGVRPASPFLYKIPATGQKPMEFEVVGLPKGLTLDKQTGIISGSLSVKGNYAIKLSAKNTLGVAHKDFTIVCGDLVGLTPALGWNSWNCWGLSVSDEKVRASAKIMLDKLADYGWSYINIDDGWEDKRDPSGNILPNNKFPDMKKLSDYVHSLGLKIGIYSSPGTLTCGGFLGSYQHETQDANTYADWGIDYLKYDWCSYGQIAPVQPSLEDYQKPYILMRKALTNTKRDILFSFCQYGMGDVWKWGASVGGNSWRTTGDISDSWQSMSGIGFSQDKMSGYSQPGHFNDPDMLVVGKVGWGPSLHNTQLSPDEQYTHISLWSLLSSPLLIGCDMSQLDDFTLNLLTNAEVLDIDQDPLGKGAAKVWDKNGIQVWVKDLKDGNKAIGIFNLEDKSGQAKIAFSDIRLPGQLKLRNVWKQQDLGVFTNSFQATLPAHGVILLKTHK